MTYSAERIEEDCYKLGKDYFGPFLYGFVKWLHREIVERSIDKAFFLSRDGYMMIKAYRHLFGNDNTRYIYFSRNSLRMGLLYKCRNYSESIEYLTKERYISLSKILKYYGFGEKEQEEISKKYGIPLEAEYLLERLSGENIVKNIYDNYTCIIKKRSYAQARMLRKYLEQNNVSGRCAIIDIGWHGSMQYYLEQFAENEGIELNVLGLYVGIDPIYQTKGTMRGYAFSPTDFRNRKKVLCFLGGYERLFQSQDGSTKGYKEEREEIVPILDSYEYEGRTELKKAISLWQQGAMEYIHSDKKSEDETKLIGPIMKFGMNPPQWGIEIFKDFFIKDGSDQVYVSTKPLYKYHIKELIHTLSNSVWKTGFMKSIMRIPFPYYWIYAGMRR